MSLLDILMIKYKNQLLDVLPIIFKFDVSNRVAKQIQIEELLDLRLSQYSFF